ncbi:hypothetical protein BDN72DRAFT_803960 [Pluteus cervinus]|uniref:Uncharacterized protein n=1 Tax=Pluteus cervinus TaxID=181527 RepID=A0ACD3A9X7_9AGAR|nr:hypothetical protein BDN72DRAFT_803960 [Pluteus cervinus]
MQNLGDNVSSGNMNKRPHERFFFDDAFVVLEVESTLFRLPSFMLKNHSPKLGRLVELSASPIQLRFITAQDFERFLSILFPIEIGQYAISSVDEWSAVLKVAHIWDSSAIRKLAVAQLESIATPIDRIVHGIAYDIPKLVASGYVELCQRDGPITVEEGTKLGLVRSLEISSIRHYLRSAESSGRAREFSVVEFCSGPGRQLLGNNGVADYLLASLEDGEGVPNPASFITDTAPEPADGFDNNTSISISFVPDAAPVDNPGNNAPVPAWKKTQGVWWSDDIPSGGWEDSEDDDNKPLVQKPAKRRIRSEKTLCLEAWRVKYAGILGKKHFKGCWNNLSNTTRQVWETEWNETAKNMSELDAKEFIRTPRIQALLW